MKPINFVDLHAQYETIKSEIDECIANVLKNTAFIGGKSVKQFEEDFRTYIGTEYCISCANGTDSLEILLEAMGVGDGDEVIVPAMSWFSTSEVVSRVGATPIFVDVDETYTIDPSLIEAATTSKTKAIIPVHLYGHPADMIAIMEIAKKHGLKVVEDCAQAHAAEIGGQKIGTFGDAASFSFYPGKNLGAYGDAGAMVTDDPEIAKVSRMIANHGQLQKHDHQIEGRNSRLDGMQAAILSVKLPYLDNWTNARKKNAEEYKELLSSNIQLPVTSKDASHVYHLFVIQHEKRDELAAFLKENNVACAVHYPVALPFLKPYADMNYKTEDFPNAHGYSKRILSLPMYAELTSAEIGHVASLINEFCG